MDSLDPLLLARLQFAANISFHILFPSISIALGWVLLYFKTRFVATRQAHWMDAYQFWVKVFALTFALGVVSGVTMSFQFGTNWPGFMNTVGNVAGPLLAYEVLTAFFLEATMLGIMLFGRERVSERVHTIATFLVAAGTTASAFWILALNSWMHTPAGFEMIDGQAHVTSWWEVVFNPSFPYRLTHMLIASGLTVAFLLAGLSAYRWLRQDRGADVRAALRAGVLTAAVLIPVQAAARLLPPPQPRNVEMHADHAQSCVADADRRRDRAARFERRQMQRMALLDFGALANEQRIAVPADAVRAIVEADRDIVAMLVEHVRRDRAGAGTETPVGFLQGDDVGVEFAEHRQNPPGVAAPVEPDALAHIVTGDFDHGLSGLALQPPSRSPAPQIPPATRAPLPDPRRAP